MSHSLFLWLLGLCSLGISGGAEFFAFQMLHRYTTARMRGEMVESWSYFLMTSGLLILAFTLVAALTTIFAFLVFRVALA